MPIRTPPKVTTSDELFALPSSKKWVRLLVRGELRERRVTNRNPNHSSTTANLSYWLIAWLRTQPEPRGRVYDGEAYFRIRRDPETNVGIDVALASAEQVAATTRRSSYVDGPPVLAAEVLSPNDKQRDIDEAVGEYIDCGVRVVWIVNPVAETVTVYRPGHPTKLFNNTDELADYPELPGFRVPVAALFQ